MFRRSKSDPSRVFKTPDEPSPPPAAPVAPPAVAAPPAAAPAPVRTEQRKTVGDEGGHEAAAAPPKAIAIREIVTMDTDKKTGVDTLLGDDTTFTGKIESRGTLRIDGRVEGEIIARDSIVIGPSGVVKANINGAVVSISGQVNGNIAATKKVELHPTAVVVGDIATAIGALTIEAGAKFDGRCAMSSDKPATAAAPAAVSRPPDAPKAAAPGLAPPSPPAAAPSVRR